MKIMFFIILMGLIAYLGCEKNSTQPITKEYEMKTKDNLSLKGFIDITIKRANGDIEKWHQKNTIIVGLKNAIAANFEAALDIAIDAFFDGNTTPPTADEDGIVLRRDNDNWYEMISSISGTGGSRKFTGTFTGVAGTFNSAALGHTYYSDGEFGTDYATPTSWVNVVLAAADTLTLEWTITVGA